MVPNPDLFQYIEDSRIYAQFKLPPNIQQPPANPMLIAILTPLFGLFEYPEVISAHIINIASSLTIILFLYLLIRTYSHLVALVTVILLVTNPLFIFSSLDITSEVLYTAAVIFVLWLYKTERKMLAYLLAGLSFLIRFEAVLVVGAFAVADWSVSKNIRKVLKVSLIGITPILVWFLVINRQNFSGHFLGNTYVREVIDNKHNLPQLELIKQAPFLLMDNFPQQEVWSYLFYAIILMGILLLVLWRDTYIRMVYLIVFSYLFLHILFPFAPFRYLIPVMWSLYLLPLLVFRSIYKKFFSPYPLSAGLSLVFAGILVMNLIYGNVVYIRGFYQDTNVTNMVYPRYHRYEDRLAASWLNRNVKVPTKILTYDPGILDYYTGNPNAEFLYLPYSEFQKCDSILCVVTSNSTKLEEKPVLFVQKRYSTLEDASFPSFTNYHATIFNNFPNLIENDSFSLIHDIEMDGLWFKIFEFTPGHQATYY